MPQAKEKISSRIQPTGVKVSPTVSSADVAQMASHMMPLNPLLAPITKSITSMGRHM